MRSLLLRFIEVEGFKVWKQKEVPKVEHIRISFTRSLDQRMEQTFHLDARILTSVSLVCMAQIEQRTRLMIVSSIYSAPSSIGQTPVFAEKDA